MTETLVTAIANAPQSSLPRYQAAEFGNVASLQRWFDAHPEYDFISMAPIAVTNHFSKETETSVWAVFKLRENS